MKYNFVYLTIVVLIFQSCKSQSRTIPKREIHNKEFNWRITIPENFEGVSSEKWSLMQNKGTDAIEKSYEGKVKNRAKIIFVFKSDQLNYFESNYQPFDTLTDGNYNETCQAVNNVLYQTFISQIPNAVIDTSTHEEIIDNLKFRTFKMKIVYPNKLVMKGLLYSRLFDKKEFSANIFYVDDEKGNLMIDSWKNSKFR